MKTDLEIIDPLSPAESDKYERLKLEVAKNQKHVEKWVEAIREIRDERLYRVEFGTWENYCTAKLKKSIRSVQMAFALEDVRKSVAQHASPEKTQQMQALADASSARTLKKLAKVPKKDRPEVLEEAGKKTGGKPTAKAVDEAAARKLHKPLPQKPPPARAIHGTDAPVDTSLYSSAPNIPKRGTMPPKRTDTPPENERAKDAAEITKVTDEETAAKRIEEIYSAESLWLNCLSPQRSPTQIKDRIVKAMLARE